MYLFNSHIKDENGNLSSSGAAYIALISNSFHWEIICDQFIIVLPY